MYIQTLTLEITRRCNMQCDHCLRGEAQVLDMDLSIIDKVLESGVGISGVVFTGGEPSLYPEAIKYFVDRLRYYGKSISSFYVKTNGKVESLSMAVALLDLYSLVDEPEMCHLDVSRDQFHTGNENPRLYEGLKFYVPGKHNDYKMDALYNEGLAFDNGWGTRNPESSRFYFDGEDSVETVQIAANGNVCGQCDISFEREDEETYGSILDKPLDKILEEAYHNEVEQAA